MTNKEVPIYKERVEPMLNPEKCPGHRLIGTTHYCGLGTEGDLLCWNAYKHNCQIENPVIVQLKKELAEARECELTARALHNGGSVSYWAGYQKAVRRAIKIVEGK